MFFLASLKQLLPFSQEHLLCLIIILTLGAWILKEACTATGQEKKAWEHLFIVILLISAPLSFLWKIILLPTIPWQELLPLHLCNIIPYIAVYALLTRKELAIHITYSLGVIACVQALITPALLVSFPHPLFFHFFITHLLIVLIALYFPLGCSWRPKKHDINHTFYCCIAYLIAMLCINPFLGTNYGFVMHSPPNGSILDLLGPWPWYLISMLAIGYGLIALVTLPLVKKTPPQT